MYKIVGNYIIVKFTIAKSVIFDVYSIFPPYWHRHDDFENFLMHILKVEVFYPPMDNVPTRFWNISDVKITICYD